jgi:anti-sigma factor RsiW
MKPRCEQAIESIWVAGLSGLSGLSEIAEAPEVPVDPAVVEARRHVAECPPCREFLRRDAVLAARLRDLRLCGATPCPEQLREHLTRDLAGAQSSVPSPAASPGDGARLVARIRKRRWPAWAEGAAAAVAASLLIGTGLMLSGQLEAGLPDEAFVEDFRRTALPEIVRANVSREEVTAFYRSQFGADGPALMLDAPVTKVAVCILDGRLGALVEYDLSGERVVFYQVSRSEEGGRVGDMRTEVEGELTVVRWVDTSYDYALVGSLPREELARIASSART